MRPIDYFTEEFYWECEDEFFHLPNYDEYANGDFDLIFNKYKSNFSDDEDDDIVPSREDFIDYVIC